MEYADYYAVLGVDRTADQKAIKAAYRKLARQLHPDVNTNSADNGRFKKVNEAYEVLKDPEKRRKYDELGANWEQFEQAGPRPRRGGQARGGGPQGFSDFFETFFGSGGIDIDEILRGAAASGGRTFHFSTGDDLGGFHSVEMTDTPRRGRDLEHPVDVSLEEAARGASRLLDTGTQQVEVRIPAGVVEGAKVRVGGHGGHGSGGGRRGDVYLRVHLRPDPRFTVTGRDLATEVRVADDVAVLGGEVTVAGLTGSLSVTIPPRSTDGRTMRLRGKGLPGLGRGSAGDLLLTLRITVPTDPTPEELEHYRALRALRGGEPARSEERRAAPA